MTGEDQDARKKLGVEAWKNRKRNRKRKAASVHYEAYKVRSEIGYYGAPPSRDLFWRIDRLEQGRRETITGGLTDEQFEQERRELASQGQRIRIIETEAMRIDREEREKAERRRVFGSFEADR